LLISPNSRLTAQTSLKALADAFNKSVEDLSRQGAMELREIERKREDVWRGGVSSLTNNYESGGSNGNGGHFKEGFEGLGGVVTEGIRQVLEEHERQLLLRKLNEEALAVKLASLAKDFAGNLAIEVSNEAKKSQVEDTAFRILEGRILAEKEQQLMVADLMYSSNGESGNTDNSGRKLRNNLERNNSSPTSNLEDDEEDEDDSILPPRKLGTSETYIACQYVGDHLPDYQFLDERFLAAQATPSTRSKKDEETVNLLKVYRVFNDDLVRRFNLATSSANGVVDSDFVTLYACCNIAECKRIITHGLSSSNVNSEKTILLFSDPGIACKLGAGGKSGDINGGGGVALSPKANNKSNGGASYSDSGSNGQSSSKQSKILKVTSPLRKLASETGSLQSPSSSSSPSTTSPGKSSSSSNDDFAAFYLIQFRVCVPQSLSLSTVSLDAAPKRLQDIKHFTENIPKNVQGIQFSYYRNGGPNTGEKTSFFCFKPEACDRGGVALPEYHLLCGNSHLKSEIRRVENILEGLNTMENFRFSNSQEMSSNAANNSEPNKNKVNFDSLSNLLSIECARYQESLWEEVDPDIADRLRQTDKEMRMREEVLLRGKEDVENEREIQEGILKDFRIGVQQQHHGNHQGNHNGNYRSSYGR